LVRSQQWGLKQKGTQKMPNIRFNDNNTITVVNDKSYRDLTVPFNIEKNDPRTFYAVKVVWETGDSGGRSEELCSEVIMVYENEDVAFNCLDLIVAHHKKVERREWYYNDLTKEEQNEKFDKYHLTIPLQDIGDNKLPLYVSWEGHFEHLKSAEIIDVTLQEIDARKRKVEF
jgi:hypothetical protein